MHNLDLYRLLLDFGFLILIWIVQLIIYPGFRYRSAEDLELWHKVYSMRITLILIPLFIGQLLTSVLQLWQIQSYYTITSVTIILLLWFVTLLVFMPMHRKISTGSYDHKLLLKLERLNWMRTALWTILFLISFLNILRLSVFL